MCKYSSAPTYDDIEEIDQREKEKLRKSKYSKKNITIELYVGARVKFFSYARDAA